MFAVKDKKGKTWICTAVHNYGEDNVYVLTRPIDSHFGRYRAKCMYGNDWDYWAAWSQSVTKI